MFYVEIEGFKVWADTPGGIFEIIGEAKRRKDVSEPRRSKNSMVVASVSSVQPSNGLEVPPDNRQRAIAILERLKQNPQGIDAPDLFMVISVRGPRWIKKAADEIEQELRSHQLSLDDAVIKSGKKWVPASGIDSILSKLSTQKTFDLDAV